jgi:ATP-dependent DNA helicase RecG
VTAPNIIDPLEVLASLNWEESQELEFKSAKGGLPKSLWETYSAMANTHGGIILLGVEDNGAVSGVFNPGKLKKAFWDTVNNRGKVSANLLTDTDFAEFSHPAGGLILVIRVPQATRHQRPVYLDQNPFTGTYRRNHEGDYHCNEQEVSRMLSDRAEESADSRILERFGLEDIDLPSLQQYRQRLASYKPIHPWLSEDDKGLLVKLAGWRRDRKTGLEGLTVAGLVMFGRDEAIREGAPHYHVDYREQRSDNFVSRWTDRLTMDGTWNANLFQFYLRVIQRLSADLKMPFQLDAELFRKGETEVHEAIREALVNALIHADYQGTGGVVIIKYQDKFEFSNPGTLLISLEQLLRGNVSECRNKTLQTMFMMIGAAEKAGSGVDKIRKGWNSQHWRSPLVRERVQPDRVDWSLPMVSLIPNESLAKLHLKFADRFQTFNKLEIQALVTADIESYVDNARMRQITNNHATDITRVLQGLVAKGALVQEGQARGSRYRLSPVEPDLDYVDHSLHNADHSLHNADHSLHNADHSPHNADHSPHNSDFSPIAELAQKKKRLTSKEMEYLILTLCKDRWLSRKQLSELLHRNPEGLLSRFLTPMVDHGLLVMKFPDKPNRVDQAYQTASQDLLDNVPGIFMEVCDAGLKYRG